MWPQDLPFQGTEQLPDSFLTWLWLPKEDKTAQAASVLYNNTENILAQENNFSVVRGNSKGNSALQRFEFL